MFFVQYVVNGLSIGAIYSLIAVGYGLVFGVLNVLNMAHPEILMIGAIVGATVFEMTGSVWLALLATLASSVVVGVVLERTVIRGTARSSMATFIVTAGVAIILQNSAALYIGSAIAFYPALSIGNGFLDLGGIKLPVLSLVVLLTGLMAMAGTKLLVERTRFGLAIRSIAENEEIARSLGVNTSRAKMKTFALASFLAGIAAVLYGWSFIGIDPFLGLHVGVVGLVAVIIGGIDSLSGAMLAGLLIGLIESLSTAYVGPEYKGLVTFIALIVVIVVKPSGLLGRRSAASV